MPVPFEALLPYGILITMLTISGAGLQTLRTYRSEGKQPRYGLDSWDKQMMERDRRLTGTLRGQSDSPTAPKGFELSSEWKLEKRFF